MLKGDPYGQLLCIRIKRG